jgi:outer membrane protein OmpA-like peptidoglycan-associated protein
MRFIIYLILLPVIFSAQKKLPDSVYCDCAKARPVILRGTYKLGPTLVPNGAGNINEISVKQLKTKFAFEKEHHSAWYKLIVNIDGNLVFDILPENPDDDYDFMIFKAEYKNFCDTFLKLKTQPIRACISRNKKEKKGVTGLKFKNNKEFIKEGPGEAFAKPLEVKKGETYYLVLDNVHSGGGGHSIQFFFEELITLKGQITDENNKPVKADVTITNFTGDTIDETKSDKDGFYKLETSLRKLQNYSINYYSENSFFATKEFSLKTEKDSLVNIKTILPTLKKGNKYNIRNINFYGGSYNYLPSALPSILNLYKLMKKNPTLKILIVGHINGCQGASLSLSENRALTIKKFLIEKGIDETRMSTEGRGCKEMLYPNGVDGPEWQSSLNRRVEIKVVER